MKIARLALLLLAMTVTVVSAGPATPSQSGTFYYLYGQYWYYCYASPTVQHQCFGYSSACQQECEITCGGPCLWTP